MKTRLNHNRARQGGVLIKVLLGLGILLALGAVLWVTLLPELVVSTIHRKTGFAVKVDGLSVNPFTGVAEIKGLVLNNPAGWPAEGFVDLREFRVAVNLFSLWSDRFVAREVVVDLPQITLVKNQQGVLNATAFRNGFTGRGEAGQPNQGGTGTKQGFLIRHLVLKFGKLVYADYSGRKPVIKEYNLNLNQDMRDVDSVAKIISPLTGSALGLVSGTIGGLFKGSPDLLKDTTGVIQEAGKKAGEKLKGLLDALDKKKP
jgi:uncharacterized protein involved in outer membrane biogenesis